jgi:methylenetetrahydrofolate--tRNA-(uracil-5-)-methyltransferase
VGSERLAFFDAAAPIVDAESLDRSKVFSQSRYEREQKGDYLNCPMNRDEYEAFWRELVKARRVVAKEFEQRDLFNACQPVEELARKGIDTLRLGPLKPVGIKDPATGRRPWAVVQLRAENAACTAYNLVGFQTNLTWTEQARVFHMIPGLTEAEFVRYGVMHRNTYINSPKWLKETYQFLDRDDLFFAGQMTGVEGYIESSASGMLAGINLAHVLNNEEPVMPSSKTMIGAMSHYISTGDPEHFQPMNANFGIMYLEGKVKKKDRKADYAPQSLSLIREMIQDGRL